MQITVRVLAVADPSMRNVFAPLEQSSERAYKKTSGGAKKSARESTEAIKAGLRDQAAAAGSAYRQSGRAAEESVRVVELTEKRKQQIRDRIREQTFRNEQRDAERSERAAVAASKRAIARTEMDARRSGTDAIGGRRRAVGAYRDFGRDVVGTVGRGASAVMGATGEIARGAGIDASMGGLTQRVLSTEQAAIKATSAGMVGQGKVATQQDVDATMAAIRATGDKTNTAYSTAAAGLDAFTGKASDLEGGKKALTELMQISQATGSNFVELSTAAGAVSQSLEEGPKKGEKMLEVMRMIAKQAAMGSVEMKDLATYMPRISAQSEKFAGDRVQTMGQFGAIAQMAVHSGRSTSAEATNSAAAFARDLTTNSGNKRMREAGIGIFTDKTNSKMRSPEEIIRDIYKKTGGDQVKLSALMRNSTSRAAVESFSDVYKEAGGGAKGLDAISAKFREFNKVLSAGEVESIANLQRDSKSGKAQEMQNRFETTWAEALNKIAPAMERLAPSIGKVADSFASLVVYLAENPGKAIAMALTASVAKAGLGAVLSAAVERAIMGGGKGGPGGAGGGGGALGGGLAGNLLTGLTIAATAVTITAAGVTLIDQAFKDEEERKAKADRDVLDANIYAENAKSRIERGAITQDEAMAELKKTKAELEAKVASGESAPTGVLSAAGRGQRDLWNFVSGSGPSFDASKNDMTNKENLASNKEALASVNTALETLGSKTLTVRVVNMPADGGGFAVTRTPGDGTGRTGPGT